MSKNNSKFFPTLYNFKKVKGVAHSPALSCTEHKNRCWYFWRFFLLLYKLTVDCVQCFFKVVFFYADDNGKFTGTLVNHADVDTAV